MIGMHEGRFLTHGCDTDSLHIANINGGDSGQSLCTYIFSAFKIGYFVDPSLQVTPSYGERGASIQVSGQGFTPNIAVVTVLYTCEQTVCTHTTIGTGRTRHDGSFTDRGTIPRDTTVATRTHYYVVSLPQSLASTGLPQLDETIDNQSSVIANFIVNQGAVQPFHLIQHDSSSRIGMPGCPQTWACGDVGATFPGTQAVTTTAGGATWTVRGSGVIANASDSFHYVWRPLTGDGTVRARVVGHEGLNVGACVMMRQGTDPGAPFYAICDYNIGATVDVIYRAKRDVGVTSLAGIGAVGLPRYFGIGRAGDTFTAYVSDDGATWAPINRTSVAIGAMGSTVEAGVAVTSNNDGNGTLDAATFDHVAVATGALFISG